MIELPESDTFYQVTGVVRNIYNTSYGNFYLYNLEESVYITVYGLTKEQVSSNDKSFATLGIKEGDIVTLMGTRSDYNGTAQIGGPAYYVSHTSPEYEVTLEVEGEGQASLSANKVENGKSVTLTVSANEGYKLASIKANDKNISLVANQEEYEITVNAKTTIKVTFIEDSGQGEEEQGFVLLTDVTKLQVGDKIVIAAMGFDYAISTTQNTNNRAQAAITRLGNTITFGEDVLVLTVEAGTKANTFAFNTGSGYLYAASTSKNYLKTETTLSDNSSWEITISADGVATIKAQGTNTKNWMRYNSTNNPPLFACYGSGQADICIYRESAGGTITPVEKTDAEKVALDKNALTLPSTTEENLTLPTSGANGTTISWSSSDEDVIALDGFVIRQAEDVEVTLTATIKLNDVTDTKEFTITVVAEKAPIEAVIYELVTDASTLKAGDKIIIVSSVKDVAMSTTQNGNNRGEIAITKLTNSISVTDSEVQVLTVQDGNKTGTLAFYTGAGYLYAASSSSNYLRTETALSDNSSWSITIDENGIATIIAQGTNSKNKIQYNQSSSIFACYASDSTTQKGVNIYRATSSN